MMIQQTGPAIPRSDSALEQFLTNFAAIVARNPAAVGLTAMDSQVLSGYALQYQQVLAKAISPLTNAAQVINDKDTIRNQARDTFRIYIAQIKANAGVDDSLKIALGIHINKVGGTPIPAPMTFPILSIVGTEPGVHLLRYADSSTPTRRAKPAGAVQMWLYSHIGDAPTANYQKATLVGAFTRVPMTVTYEPKDGGKTVSYWGRWVTQRGLLGPWGLPVSMQVAFGGPVEQAVMGGNSRTGELAARLAA